MGQHKNYGPTQHRGAPGQPQTQEVHLPPVDYQMGHNESHLLIMFESRPQGMALDDKGYDIFMKHLIETKARLDAYRAKKPNG